MKQKEKKKKDMGDDYSNFALRLVLVCTILILGSSIIFSFRNNFIKNNNEKEDKAVDQELIDKLYGYVTYGREFQEMRYFYVNNILTSDIFDGGEKVKYAFQFVNKDNISDLTSDSFTIDGKLYESFIETIFGENTTYYNLDEFEIVSTNVFENSVVNVKYDPDSDKYLVTKIRDLTVRNDNTIQPFYSKIVDSSINKADNTLSVTEKIFFTRIDYDDNNNVKLIRIYKDCLDQNLIAEINNNTGNQIEEFNMENYLDKAMTVTYTFKLSDDGNYYFDNSKIEE